MVARRVTKSCVQCCLMEDQFILKMPHNIAGYTEAAQTKSVVVIFCFVCVFCNVFFQWE